MIVHGLFVYPIKSLRGIALTEATLERRGFRHDRRWMLVDAAGTFITQRDHPEMARIEVALARDAIVVQSRGPLAMPPLSVPIRAPEGPRRAVRIWNDTCDAVAIEGEAARWFREVLGVACDLVYMPEDSERPVDPAYARASDRVGFADGFPLLLASASSLDELNRRMREPLTIERFRPNLVVGGSAPFAEDAWTELAIGDVGFRVAKPCERCAITTIDPATGAKGFEPLKTLAKFRKRGAGVTFGQNLLHDREGTIRVGDSVRAFPSAR